MQITFILPAIISAVFGLVVAAVYFLIVGWAGVRVWLGSAWVLACLCYITLFGVIKL